MSVANSVPDFALKCRFDAEQGHLQVASIFRDWRGYSPALGESHIFGWDLTLAGAHSIASLDSVLLQTNYGDGTGRYLVDLDGQRSDAAFHAQAKLEALPAFGGYVVSTFLVSTMAFGSHLWQPPSTELVHTATGGLPQQSVRFR